MKKLRAKLFATIFTATLLLQPLFAMPRAGAACFDFGLVWLRGEGQTAVQPSDGSFSAVTAGSEAYNFFTGFDSRIANWIPLEKINFDNQATSNSTSYTASGAFNWSNFGATTAPAASSALVDATAYNTSVANGKQELLDFLNAKAIACPSEKFVLGGYSQGAQVIGEALNDASLSATATGNILYTAMYGDPRFNIDSSSSESWMRGDTELSATGGVLSPREPYVPTTLLSKTGSWCDKRDLVCSSVIASSGLSAQAGHEVYADDWLDQGVNEAVIRLDAAFPAYVGAINPSSFIPSYGENRNVDIMLVIDTTKSMESVINDIKASASTIVSSLFSNFAGTGNSVHVGVTEFRDSNNGSPFVARTDVDLTGTQSVVVTGLNSLAAEASTEPDGAEQWYAGINKALEQNWRVGAQKIVLVVADTAPKDPEPTSGSTANSVVQAALAIDPVQIYSAWLEGFVTDTAGFTTAANALGNGTGGRLVKNAASTNGNVAASLQNIFLKSGVDPVAYLNGPATGNTGQTLQFSASPSYAPTSYLTTYKWDFDNDGTTDLTSSSPLASHSYATPYSGKVVLTIQSAIGGMGSGTLDIQVGTPVSNSGGGNNSSGSNNGSSGSASSNQSSSTTTITTATTTTTSASTSALDVALSTGTNIAETPAVAIQQPSVKISSPDTTTKQNKTKSFRWLLIAGVVALCGYSIFRYMKRKLED